MKRALGIMDPIRARKLSPIELVRTCLARIERYDGALRAYVMARGERALMQAQQVKRDIGNGHYQVRCIRPRWRRLDFRAESVMTSIVGLKNLT